MWGRFWSSLYPLLSPFPHLKSVEPSEEAMKAKNYTVEKIFKVNFINILKDLL